MQAALAVDFVFALPVIGGGVAADGWIDAKIGALPTSRTPTLAFQRVRTVAAQQPGIVQGDNGWRFGAQLRQCPQIEEASIISPIFVQVVQVQDVGWNGDQIEEMLRTRGIEDFAPPLHIPALTIFRKRDQPAAKPPQPDLWQAQTGGFQLSTGFVQKTDHGWLIFFM